MYRNGTEYRPGAAERRSGECVTSVLVLVHAHYRETSARAAAVNLRNELCRSVADESRFVV